MLEKAGLDPDDYHILKPGDQSYFELTEALWRQMIGWFVQYEEEKLRRSLEGNGSRGA